MKLAHGLRRWYLPVVVILVLSSVVWGRAVVFAQTGSATSSAIPSDATPAIGEQIEVVISIDVTDVAPPDERLGSYSGSLNWNPAVLAYDSYSGAPPPGFAGVVNTSAVASGHIVFNGANANGATGNVTVFRITFDVVEAGSSNLDLEYSAMAAAGTFQSLLPLLTVTDGQVEVSPVEHTLTVAVDPVGGGTTDPEAGVHTYVEGAAVDVTATPAEEYKFEYWSGDCSGTGGCQVTMDADKTVTAHFKLSPGPTILPPDLSLTMEDGGDAVGRGDTISYLLTYSNAGDDATGVVITETVPANTTFDSAASTSGWVCQPDGNAGSSCTLDLGVVTSSGDGSVIFAVTVDDQLPADVTEIDNTAEIGDDGSGGADPSPGTNTASVHTAIERYLFYLPLISRNR